MSTEYPEIFEALAEEFGPREVRTRPQGRNQLPYITARAVMNRLDSAIGPENWWDEYTPLQNGVLCRLTIRLPDGRVITKADAGGHAGMSDEGDDEKSGFSDALKRAAVKFGVGRHLYGEGVPRYRPTKKPKRAESVQDGPTTLKEVWAWVKAVDPEGKEGLRDQLIAWGKERGFPLLFKEWSNEQAVQGYAYVTSKMMQEAKS